MGCKHCHTDTTWQHLTSPVCHLPLAPHFSTASLLSTLHVWLVGWNFDLGRSGQFIALLGGWSSGTEPSVTFNDDCVTDIFGVASPCCFVPTSTLSCLWSSLVKQKHESLWLRLSHLGNLGTDRDTPSEPLLSFQLNWTGLSPGLLRGVRFYVVDFIFNFGHLDLVCPLLEKQSLFSSGNHFFSKPVNTEPVKFIPYLAQGVGMCFGSGQSEHCIPLTHGWIIWPSIQTEPCDTVQVLARTTGEEAHFFFTALKAWT